jgi:dinuclear metal center YbgI/SA1388 family protein
MSVKARDIMNLMNEWAPPFLAEKWDHPGLQIGDPDKEVRRVMVALDVTESNVKAAAEQGVDMIISHHPFLFRPLKEIDLSKARGRITAGLIRAGIVSFAAHTNLDSAEEGVNDALAEALGLENTEGLVPVYEEKQYKVIVHCYYSDAKRIGELFSAFNPVFRREEDARRGYARFNLTESSKKQFMKLAEQAGNRFSYDLYPLDNPGKRSMMGRIGSLPQAMTGMEALRLVRERLHMPVLRWCGPVDRTVESVAVLGGAGGEFAGLAKAKGADLYVTGDLKYHEAQDLAAMGILVADGGHFYTERVIIPYLARRLRNEFEKRHMDVAVMEDTAAEDIFHYIAE